MRVQREKLALVRKKTKPQNSLLRKNRGEKKIPQFHRVQTGPSQSPGQSPVSLHGRCTVPQGRASHRSPSSAEPRGCIPGGAASRGPPGSGAAGARPAPGRGRGGRGRRGGGAWAGAGAGARRRWRRPRRGSGGRGAELRGSGGGAGAGAGGAAAAAHRLPDEAVVDGEHDGGQRDGEHVGQHGGQAHPLLVGLGRHARLLVPGVSGGLAPLRARLLLLHGGPALGPLLHRALRAGSGPDRPPPPLRTCRYRPRCHRCRCPRCPAGGEGRSVGGSPALRGGNGRRGGRAGRGGGRAGGGARAAFKMSPPRYAGPPSPFPPRREGGPVSGASGSGAALAEPQGKAPGTASWNMPSAGGGQQCPLYLAFPRSYFLVPP